MNTKTLNYKRWNIILVNLNPTIDSEQGDQRPVLIIAPITEKVFSKNIPTNVFLLKKISKLNKNSTILLNQIRTIEKKRVKNKLSQVNKDILREVELALIKSLGIENFK